MSYSVKLDVYEGPLELLLELISKERVDVAEVSISTITDEYLKAVSALGEVDLDPATNFLVLAATLLELKSYKLLPVKDRVDADLAAVLEERDHLVHRLIEYSTFKQVALLMKDRFALNQGFYLRTADVPKELVGPAPDLLEGVSVEMLGKSAARALAPKPVPVVDTTHVTPIMVSIGETVALLVREIQVRGVATFRELSGGSSKMHVIVRFLALLQMFKEESVELEQPQPFEEITVRWRTKL